MKSSLLSSLLLLALVGSTPALAQSKMLEYTENSKLPSYPLFVSDQKTVHLVFPYPVTYVDLGSAALVAGKATGAENIVRVKAATAGMPETNMTVLTSNGKLYSFVVNYQHDPQVLSVDLGQNVVSSDGKLQGPNAGAERAILSKSPMGQGNLDAFSRQLLAAPGFEATENKDQMTLKAGHVGYREETMFFPLLINNKSTVTYDIDFVKFYIRDKKVAKRTAEQAVEITPMYVFQGSQRKIESNELLKQVYVFKKFTIPEAKQLVIELYEKNGGRQLKLTLTNAELLKALTFNN